MDINTPTAAKDYARHIAANCFNDEVRAIVARELLERIVQSSDPSVADALADARWSAAELVTAYDRQYRD